MKILAAMGFGALVATLATALAFALMKRNYACDYCPSCDDFDDAFKPCEPGEYCGDCYNDDCKYYGMQEGADREF